MSTTPLTPYQQAKYLRALGWRIRSRAERIQAIRNFQAGWNLGDALTVAQCFGNSKTFFECPAGFLILAELQGDDAQVVKHVGAPLPVARFRLDRQTFLIQQLAAFRVAQGHGDDTQVIETVANPNRCLFRQDAC